MNVERQWSDLSTSETDPSISMQNAQRKTKETLWLMPRGDDQLWGRLINWYSVIKQNALKNAERQLSDLSTSETDRSISMQKCSKQIKRNALINAERQWSTLRKIDQLILGDQAYLDHTISKEMLWWMLRGNDQIWALVKLLEQCWCKNAQSKSKEALWLMLRGNDRLCFDECWEAMIRFEHLWNCSNNADAKMLEANQKEHFYHFYRCSEAMINFEEDWSINIRDCILNINWSTGCDIKLV